MTSVSVGPVATGVVGAGGESPGDFSGARVGGDALARLADGVEDGGVVAATEGSTDGREGGVGELA